MSRYFNPAAHATKHTITQTPPTNTQSTLNHPPPPHTQTGTLSEIIGARALHGDIAQAQREATLAGFRDGKFSVLVATDVAARGLDISGVELVIQVEPPKDPETYIHRSGRTGRAGHTGVCITLVGRKHESLVPFIEKRAGFKFE